MTQRLRRMRILSMMTSYIFFRHHRRQNFVTQKSSAGRLDTTDHDLYHCQGVWQYPTYITAKKARKFKKPYVITPRGMLYPQQLTTSEIHKKIAPWLSTSKTICSKRLHPCYLYRRDGAPSEFGDHRPGSGHPKPNRNEGFLETEVSRPEKMRFGYLGRVHPRKNIERILYAWDRLGDAVRDKELVIIGAGDESYHQFLKDEAARLGLTNVEFTGFLSGEAKEEKLSHFLIWWCPVILRTSG